MDYPIIAKSKITGIIYKFINSNTGIVLKRYRVGRSIKNLKPPTHSDFIIIKEPITFKEL